MQHLNLCIVKIKNKKKGAVTRMLVSMMTKMQITIYIICEEPIISVDNFCTAHALILSLCYICYYDISPTLIRYD